MDTVVNDGEQALRNHIQVLEEQLRIQFGQLEALKSLPAVARPTRPKEKLPTLREFSGKRSEWDEWCLAARNKLIADGDAIGSAKEHFLYLHSRLVGTAASTVHARAEALSQADDSNGEEFLAYLDTIYGDPNKKQRALQSLYNIRQKDTEIFANFLPKFESILANAGGSEFREEQKISLLKNAINLTLRHCLVGSSAVPTTWNGFISHLHTVSSDLAALQPTPKRYNHPNGLPSLPQTSSGHDMDWEPTRLRANRNLTLPSSDSGPRKRATWVAKETVDLRRRNGLCLRCGHNGHTIKDCSFRPAVPPMQINRGQIEDDLALARPEPLGNEKNTEEEEGQSKE